jgi:predicted Fe-Mo cluster-binding NifX family protein
MDNANRFVIENNSNKPLDLYVEPEGALFLLGRGEKVTVSEHFTKTPVNVIVSTSETGATEVSIWPGDGEVRVEKDGVDVLALIQEKGVGV